MILLMIKYKPGDKVRCTRSTIGGYTFTKGNIYIFKEYHDVWLRVEKDNTGIPNGYSPEYFEPAYIKEFTNKLEDIISD